MGFYGSINSINKSIFKPDKTYSNRYEMDKGCATDGVFVGRYVLISYNDEKSVRSALLSRVSEKYNLDVKNISHLLPGYKQQVLSAPLDADIDAETYDKVEEIKQNNKNLKWLDKVDKDGQIIIQPGLNGLPYVFGPEDKDNQITTGTLIEVKGIIYNWQYPRYNPWNAEKNYTKDQKVEYNGIIYNALQDNTNQNPKTTEGYWKVLEYTTNTIINKSDYKPLQDSELYYVDSQSSPYTEKQKDGTIVEKIRTIYRYIKLSDGIEKDKLTVVKNAYVENYLLDSKEYEGKIGRGWDATVWRKTYLDGEYKYVQVADLNSVVPTLDLTADAPTETPLAPHWDADSSNIYYRLHVQPSWGMRIKEANRDKLHAFSSDDKIYPSDENGRFVVDSVIETKNAEDNGQNHHVINKVVENKPLAVYFDAASFSPYPDKEPDVYMTVDAAGQLKVGETVTDEITMTPTGYSGTKYYPHDTKENGEDVDIASDVTAEDPVKYPDTYELSIMLPSIGQSISKMWDVVYGKGAITNYEGSFLWDKLNGNFADDTDKNNPVYIRNTDVRWNSNLGNRLSHKNGFLTYTDEDMDTLSGAINSAHDLIGMIIRNISEGYAPKVEDWDPTKIYYNRGGYFRKEKGYSYTPLNGNNLQTALKEDSYKEAGSASDFVDVRDGNYYRIDVMQTPIYNPQIEKIPKERAVALSNKLYNNYVKVDKNDQIYEGAKYGTLDPEWNTSPLKTDYERDTYYYYDSLPGGGNGYILDTEDNPSRADGVYYKIKATPLYDTSTQEGIDKKNTTKFYYKDTYYVGIKFKPNVDKEGKENWDIKDIKDFNIFKLLTEDTLSEVEANLSDYKREQYKFYPSVAVETHPGSMQSIEDVTDPQLVKDLPIKDLNDYGYIKNSDGSYSLTFKYDLDENGYAVYNANGAESYTEVLPASYIDEEKGTYKAPKYSCKVDKDQEVNVMTGYTLIDIIKTYQSAERQNQYKLEHDGKLPEGITEIYPYRVNIDSEGQLDQVFNLIAQPSPLTYSFAQTEDGGIPKDINFLSLDESSEYYYIPDTYVPPIVDETKKKYDKDAFAKAHNGNYACWVKEIPGNFDTKKGKERLENNDYYTLEGVPSNKNTDEQNRALIINFYTPESGVYYGVYKWLGKKRQTPAISFNRELAVKIKNQTQRLRDEEVDPYVRRYYKEEQLHWTPITKKLFIPNKYYYRVEENDSSYTGPYHYVLADSLDGHKALYSKDAVYVISSETGTFTPGTEWNKAVNPVPSGVTLGKRTEQWIKKPMLEFAEGMNTLHGLLIKTDNLLKAEDTLTRDTRTVQGSINALNDIIARFDTLTPSEPVMVDAYGRIHSGDYDSKQTSGYTNIGRPNASQSETTGEGDDQRWIKMTTSSGTATDFKPHIKLEHTFRAAADTTTQSNLNSDEKYSGVDAGLNVTTGDKLNLYTPIVDSTGHVVGKNTETVTLPYGFKFIDVGKPISDSLTTDTLAAQASLRADTTQDKFTINPGNKWIRLTGSDTSNGETITFAHEIHSFDKSDLAAVDLNNKVDTITLQENQYDAAGHMIKSQNRTYTLPYDFKTISTNGRKTLNNTTDLEAQAKVVAKNTQDNFNLDSGNEWVKVETDSTTNTITLSHDVKQTTSSTSAQNLSNETDGTITFQTVVDSYDATNHFSSRDTKTLTMPNSYGIITGDTGSSEATATHDTFAITTEDEWLTSKVTKDKLVIAHEGAQTIVNSKGDTTAQAPKFGQSFKALSASIDAKGHVAQLAEHTITLPTPSLTNGTGNVVTGLTLEPTAGALTESKANVGTLALTGYTTASSISAMPMATDSINTAIQKLAYVLDNKTDTVDTRIKALDSSIAGLTSGEAITGITIEDGKITGHTTDKFDLAGAASKAIEELDSVTSDLAKNEVLTKVTLKSGKLTGTGLQLGTAALKATEDFVGANEDLSTKSITSGESSMTIAQMLAKIVELETTVAQLQEKVTTLEEANKATE